MGTTALGIMLVFVGLEWGFAWFNGRTWYRFEDGLSNLGCALLSMVAHVFFLWGFVSVYSQVHQSVSVSIPWFLQWGIGLVFTDLIYYWVHRLSHGCWLLWAIHVVHHQSERFNLSVGTRHGILWPLVLLPFYLPLAWLVSPAVLLICLLFHSVFQVLIHVEWVKSLPYLEGILVTPSLHRVHHARNPGYLDRNFGGTFIVWDSLFGTKKGEDEACIFGLTKPMTSWNPVEANYFGFRELIRNLRKFPGHRWSMTFSPPGWRPGGVQKMKPSLKRPEFALTLSMRDRALFVFLVILGAAAAFALFQAVGFKSFQPI